MEKKGPGVSAPPGYSWNSKAHRYTKNNTSWIMALVLLVTGFWMLIVAGYALKWLFFWLYKIMPSCIKTNPDYVSTYDEKGNRRK